jgi:hypothetical protein
MQQCLVFQPSDEDVVSESPDDDESEIEHLIATGKW